MGFAFKCGMVLGIIGVFFWSDARALLLAVCCAVQPEPAVQERVEGPASAEKSKIIRFVRQDGTTGYVDDPADLPPDATVLEDEPVRSASNAAPSREKTRREFERVRRQNLYAAEEEGNWRTSANASADAADADLARERAWERERSRRESERSSRASVSTVTTGPAPSKSGWR
jgi:hypothetical protein